MAAPPFAESVTLSPRNAEIAAQLKREFPAIIVAGSSQEVLDRSDIVLITVRPQGGEEIISGMSFRPDHTIVSAVAALSRKRLLELVAPARTVVKAVPLPAVAQRRGVTAVYPSVAAVTELFDRLGSALPVADEAQFSAMSTASSAVATYAMLAQTTTSWLSAHGLHSLAARDYVNALLAGIVDAAGHSTESFAEIADHHATRGGLNEQLRLFLERKGLFTSVSDGLDRVMERVAGESQYASVAESDSAAN
ncbi:MAG: pyrroline-5-carboxylate reductase dimerization domain-containing protein [Bryobacteraceae bacterium]